MRALRRVRLAVAVAAVGRALRQRVATLARTGGSRCCGRWCCGRCRSRRSGRNSGSRVASAVERRYFDGGWRLCWWRCGGCVSGRGLQRRRRWRRWRQRRLRRRWLRADHVRGRLLVSTRGGGASGRCTVGLLAINFECWGGGRCAPKPDRCGVVRLVLLLLLGWGNRWGICWVLRVAGALRTCWGANYTHYPTRSLCLACTMGFCCTNTQKHTHSHTHCPCVKSCKKLKDKSHCLRFSVLRLLLLCSSVFERLRVCVCGHGHCC